MEQELTHSHDALTHGDVHACESCGRAPARRLVIRRHVGMIFLQRFVRIEPVLCRECGTRTVLRYAARTLVQGWWGMVSLLIANPFTIVMNIIPRSKQGGCRRRSSLPSSRAAPTGCV